MQHELVIDNFAGGGGASMGIERAIGRPIDYAINHDPEAIAMHAANHPDTMHLCESVFQVRPRDLCDGRPIGLAWFSPDCTHHSKAKGGKPRDSKRRGLAWIVVKYARLPLHLRPRVIMLENVEEFEEWGPLDEKGQPVKELKGTLFNKWKGVLNSLGYHIEWRLLTACDYGAPTKRTRLFLIARCDGQPIVWPEATHGPGLKPYRTAAECIDWSIPVPSIFGRKKTLAENTQKRIAVGLKRFVLDNPQPFILSIDHGSSSPGSAVRGTDEPLTTITTENRHALIAPMLVQTGYGEAPGQAPRVLDIHKPLGTVVAGGQKHALVSAFIAKHYGGVVGHGMDRPLGAITTVDHHSLVTAFFIKFYSEGGQWAGLDEPMHTIPTKDRMGLVTVTLNGELYYIADIGLRMLQPHELAYAMSFNKGYEIAPVFNGKRLSKRSQVRMIGNAVVPDMPEALVRANYTDQPGMRIAA